MSDNASKHPATPYTFGAHDICFPNSMDPLLNNTVQASSPSPNCSHDSSLTSLDFFELHINASCESLLHEEF